MSNDRSSTPGPENSFPLYGDRYGNDTDPQGASDPPGPNPYGSNGPTNAELAHNPPPVPPPRPDEPKHRGGWRWAFLPLGIIVASSLWGNFWTNGGDEVTAAVPEAVSGIEVTGSTQNVSIRIDDEVDGPTVTADRADEDFEPTISDGVLTLDTNTLGDVVVILPEGAEVEDLDITSTTGDIELQDLAATSITIESTTGGIELDDVSATTFDVTSTTAGISGSISEPAMESGRFETTTGDVELEFPDGTYRVDTQTNTGDVDVDLDQGAGPQLDVVTSTGDIELDND